MGTCRAFFFNEDGSAETAAEFYRGQFRGRYDTYLDSDEVYTQDKNYTFHVGHGVCHTYTCVAVDGSAALLQRTCEQ